MMLDFQERKFADGSRQLGYTDPMDRLTEIFKLQKNLNLKIGVDTDSFSDEQRITWILNYCRAMSQEIAELTDSVPWKWWAKYQDFNKQNAKVEIVDLFHFLVSLAQTMGMTEEDIYEAYRKKHQINLDRQASGYKTKSETDNADI